jgi:uncharacterized protein
MQSLQLTLSPEQAHTPELLKLAVAKALSLPPTQIAHIRPVRKSIDARGHFVKINLAVEVFTGKEPINSDTVELHYQDVTNKEEVIVVGAGPAGLFAALRLIELGLKPILLERGQAVTERKKDLAQMIRNNTLNPESNYCFGEGGAGAFSDGKLYTRSKKKGDVQRILSIFQRHGAQNEILYETHPHIGTDRLPQVIKAMRETILEHGGEVRFNTKVTGLKVKDAKITGVELADGSTLKSKAVILATGHSARDVYHLLHNNNIALESKGFAMGVRVEHPQELIDSIQYHRRERGEFLPAAAYNLVEQVDDRGVYSFCMCPGGHIVPASTGEKEVVVNGMSASHRNSPFANSGLVVEIRPEDLGEYQQYGVLAGLQFQQYVEELAFFNNGSKGLTAPAQRVGDFVKGKLSGSLPDCSYLPGVLSSPLHFWLPQHISGRLQQGFKKFDRKMHGYLTNEALIVGVETRSSSPIRIPRDTETYQHLQIAGLFPCGEGAGYAGGITSSAIDGENCAAAVKRHLE